MEPTFLQGILVGLLIPVVTVVVTLWFTSGFSFRLFSLGQRLARLAGKDPAVEKTLVAIADGKPKEEKPAKPSGEPLRLLALLQREGRLLDFLMEDVKNYPDAQIGVAVRDIHQKCQAALKEHLDLEPVMPQSEGATVTVPAGFDPSAVRLTGNVSGQPPFSGTLQHHGWKVAKLKLAAPPAGQDEFVVQPAEVEIP